MTDNEFALAEQRMNEAYVDYRQLSAIVAEEQSRRGKARYERTSALISKILPNSRVEKRDDNYDRIIAYNNGLTFFVYNCEQSNDNQPLIGVEISAIKYTSSIELGIKGLIAELTARLQSVQSTLMD